MFFFFFKIKLSSSSTKAFPNLHPLFLSHSLSPRHFLVTGWWRAQASRLGLTTWFAIALGWVGTAWYLEMMVFGGWCGRLYGRWVGLIGWCLWRTEGLSFWWCGALAWWDFWPMCSSWVIGFDSKLAVA